MHSPSVLSRPFLSLAAAVTFFGSVAAQAQTTSTTTSTQAKKAPVKAAPAPAKPVPAAKPAATVAKPAPVKTVAVANTPNAVTTPVTPSTAVTPATQTAVPGGTVQTADPGGTPAASAYAPNNAAASAGATAPLGYAAGLGTFRAGDSTVTAFNCLRSGTRVFCDFDETKQTSAQWPAGYGYNVIKLVVGSGRVVPAHAAHYVDQDGSTFDTAEVSSNVPVRMILEYDDVPTQYTVAALAYGTDRIQSVPITPMADAQPAGIMPARQQPAAAGTAQTAQAGGTTAAAGTTDPSAKANSTTDKASQGIDKVNNTKSSLKNLWKKAGTITQ